MGKIHVIPSKLSGRIAIPPSKSQTLRAILFAALANGKSHLHQILDSPDTEAMIQAVAALGAIVIRENQSLVLEGCKGKPHTPDTVIDCGNSGLVLRLIGALAGLIPEFTLLTGDYSIRHQRPALPLLSALEQLGVFAKSSRLDGYAPLIIRGPFTEDKATLEGGDSQPVSGLLIASAFSPFPITLNVQNPGEKPWIDLTLHWLDRLHIPYSRKGYSQYHIPGNSKIHGFKYTVPGDWSTAAFPLAAALVTNSELTLTHLSLDDLQGDKQLIFILQKMGASIEIGENTLTVKKSSSLKGISVDINDFIDALPILTVIACFAQGKTTLTGAKIARHKESDRISAITTELLKMGATIEEQKEGLIIHPSPLHGTDLHSHHDHRIALSLIVAALGAKGPSTIHNTECIAKTYPHFLTSFQAIGAHIQ